MATLQTVYSRKWFEVFLDLIPESQTATEVRFLARQLPLPAFANVLDLCCGSGRHAIPLARLGYRVTGIDQDATAIRRAQQSAPPGACFVQRDIRDLADLGTYDAALILWSSFGQFTDSDNATVLNSIATHLRPGGRLILDVYQRAFFEMHQGERAVERNGVVVTERKRIEGNRLIVELTYNDSVERDAFAWQVFLPDELAALATAARFDLLLACSKFDEQSGAVAERPRMQLVFERKS